MYALAIVALMMIGMGGAMVWLGAKYFMHPYANPRAPASAATTRSEPASTSSAPWGHDVLSDFGQAAQLAKSGDITDAEVQVDQAVAEMEDARVRSEGAASGFFSEAKAALDGILKAHTDAASEAPDSAPDTSAGHLLEHVTEARVELAAVRSSLEALPPSGRLASDQARAGAAPVSVPAVSSKSSAANLPLPPGHVVLDGPRALAANTLFDPATLGGTVRDASLFPDTSEILLPPETRQFSDNVRVENLTIAGASQTLDGIHWRNVTFIGSRLRYEDGPLDLQNVRFVRCTFGFPSDARGAQIANAIVLGKTSLMIQ